MCIYILFIKYFFQSVLFMSNYLWLYGGRKLNYMSPRNGCMEATGLKFGVYKIDGFFSSGKFLAGIRFLLRFCV